MSAQYNKMCFYWDIKRTSILEKFPPIRIYINPPSNKAALHFSSTEIHHKLESWPEFMVPHIKSAQPSTEMFLYW